MTQWQPSNRPGRRPRTRTLVITVLAAVGAAFVAVAVLRSLGGDGYRPSVVSHVQTDYHDPLQLGEAVREHYHGQYAGCGRNPDGTYACIVTADGAGASYKVTVSADGKSWSAS